MSRILQERIFQTPADIPMYKRLNHISEDDVLTVLPIDGGGYDLMYYEDVNHPAPQRGEACNSPMKS